MDSSNSNMSNGQSAGHSHSHDHASSSHSHSHSHGGCDGSGHEAGNKMQLEGQQGGENDPRNAYHPSNNGFLQDKEEMQHFVAVASSFLNYRVDSLREVARIERGFHSIGANAEYLKFNFNDRLNNLRKAIELNGEFLDLVSEAYRDTAVRVDPVTKQEYIPEENVKLRDVMKVRSTLKSVIRDWSAEGKKERDLCYQPVWEEFVKHYPKNHDETGARVRVLFPGSGLGRIVFDFACAGYGAQGNEFSYHMLFTSNFLLNITQEPYQFRIHPFIHSFCNSFQESDSLRAYDIPDVCPSDCLDPEVNDDFSMVAGEFVEIYKQQPNQWHSVCTVFFIDTAHDIVEYVKTIYTCLKPGGVWINLGPLLYHYAENLRETSIELSWEELQHVITKVGFKLTIHPNIVTNYATDPFDTMMKVSYNCIFFTATKPL